MPFLVINLQSMNGVFGHNYALGGYTGPGQLGLMKWIFGMKHAPGAGSIARPVDLQSHYATTASLTCLHQMWFLILYINY